MKVCVLTSVFPRYDGDPSAAWLVEVIKRIQARGIEVKVFCPSFRGLADQRIHEIEVRRFRYFFKRFEDLTHDHGAPNKIKSPFYKLLSVFYIFFGTLQFMAYCRKNRFDVLHVNWPFPHGIFSYFGAKMHKTRVVLHFHGAELLLVKKFPSVKRFLRHSIRHADAIASNSSFTKQKIQEIYPAPAEVIGFGPTIEEKHYVKQSNSKKQILFTGRFIERKGVEYLIGALPQALQHVNAELILTGDGDLRLQLEKLVREKNLQQHVRFAGVVSNEVLNQLYQQCDVYVLPAIVDSKGDTEGLGVVLIEALLYKKPVVASQVGGIVDIIQHYQTGLLVPQKDPKALAQAIIEVLTNENLAKRLGENGYAHIKKIFDWENIADRLVDLYQGSKARVTS